MISPDHLLQVLLSLELEKKLSSTLKYLNSNSLLLVMESRLFFSSVATPDSNIFTLYLFF